MRRNILYIVTLQFVTFLSHSQSITNSYVNPGYGTISSGPSLTYSIGDIFYGELENEQLILSAMFPGKMESTVGIPAVLPEDKILIYPNPCASIVYLRSNVTDDVYLSLYSLDGVLLKYMKFNPNQGIDIRHLPGGLYIVKITDIGQNLLYVNKLIKNY